MGERRAALFGGYSGSRALSDLFVVELRQHTVVSVIFVLINFCHFKAPKMMITIPLIIAHRIFPVVHSQPVNMCLHAHNLE